MQFSITIFEASITKLNRWQVPTPVRPYWRLYWNGNPGASVTSGKNNGAGEMQSEREQTVHLGPEKIVLIPPQTVFTVDLQNQVDHLYLHFNPDRFFSSIPGLYSVSTEDRLEQREILKSLISADDITTRRKTMEITRFICDCFLSLPETSWMDLPEDSRVNKVVSEMDLHLGKQLSNEYLASVAGMAPTAFIRHFSKLMGESPQHWYLIRRLETACLLLEFSNDSIDQIAESCGFCDRNYFTTVFKRHYTLTPAAFRRTGRG